MPLYRDADGIEACRLDNGEIRIADGVSPTTIVASCGFPGVAEINTATEGGVHDSSCGVIDWNRRAYVAAAVIAAAFVFRWCVRTAFACDECASDSYSRKKFLNHSNPQKVDTHVRSVLKIYTKGKIEK